MYVRIMYVHVPCSWGALGLYALMGLTAIYAFIYQLPHAHYLTQAMAPVGLVLCLLSLSTGAIWGKPTWGAWWVWDARLTSMLVLAFLYLGYLYTVYLIRPVSRALSLGAIIAVLGCINLPIIKWSVNWWQTLHQPASIMRFAKPAMPPEMLYPLFMLTISLALWCVTIILILYKKRGYEQKSQALLTRHDPITLSTKAER